MQQQHQIYRVGSTWCVCVCIFERPSTIISVFRRQASRTAHIIVLERRTATTPMRALHVLVFFFDGYDTVGFCFLRIVTKIIWAICVCACVRVQDNINIYMKYITSMLYSINMIYGFFFLARQRNIFKDNDLFTYCILNHFFFNYI